MKKILYDNRRRSSIILDAGYVSIKGNDRFKSSEIFGLHGKKFVCIILTVFILFFISSINLTCLIWIMYKLDWSPFYKNGSKLFYFNKVNQNIELFHQGIFHEPVYTTKIKDFLPMNFTSEKQIDIYGDHNSILFDNNQIAFNTEYFYMNEKILVDFNNLQSFKFNENKSTKIHLDHINCHYIHDKHLNIITDNSIIISDVNKVLFTSQNLTLGTNRRHHRSLIRFNNYPKTKNSFDYRQKVSYGNIDFQSDSIFLSLLRFSLVENVHRNEAGIYRMCICNTTFLLLRSFAHQPCPLC